MSPYRLHSGHSRGRRRKDELRKILLDRDWQRIHAWAADNSNALGTVSSLFFDPDRLVVWRAIDAVGRIASTTAGEDTERIRSNVRRLFWLMNDESGGISWHAPEAIAEILRAVPELIGEFGEMYVPFLVEEPFEAGVCWGIARLSNLHLLSDDMKEAIFDRADVIVNYIESDDPRLRGYATLAAAGIGLPVCADIKARLQSDRRDVEIYDFSTGELRLSPISSLAASLQI